MEVENTVLSFQLDLPESRRVMEVTQFSVFNWTSLNLGDIIEVETHSSQFSIGPP